MKSIRTEVLVVGGGPAGSIAARALARESIDTVLIEKNLSSVKPCGGGIPSTAFTELQLTDCPVSKYVDTIKIISPSGEPVPIRLKGAKIAIVNRGDFDAALREETRKSGTAILEGEFRRFIRIGKTATSEVSVGGETIHIEADHVVAADGVNSRVRAALNINPVTSLLAVSVKIREEETDCCEFWFGNSHAPRCYSWVFPQDKGISAGTGSFNYREIKTLWQRFAERRALRTPGSLVPGDGIPLRGCRIPVWQGDLFTKGKIFFTGDAAGQVLPLTYEGIYYAMKSAEFAATAIIEGRKRDYQMLWEKNFGKRFSVMKRLSEHFLRDDRQTERLVQFHKRPEVQDASMRLWLLKDLGMGSLLSYLNLYRRLFADRS